MTAFMAAPGWADSVAYTYDALGRLIEVERSDGTQTIYTLDAAGNRTQVQEGATPNAPASITVPSSSTSGSYTISWTAPTAGTVDAYELYESTQSNFSSQTRVYSGTATSKGISGKGDGTYYYRVRACSVSCGGYRTGSGGVKVRIPPSKPGAITLPATNNTGTYTVAWGAAASGTVTAYQLYEATNSSFSGATRVYNSTGTSTSRSRSDGTYYYRARACNDTACSGYTATKSVVVTIRPGVPGTMTIPSKSGTGTYTISWGPSTGNVTAYQLQEATTSGFTDAALIYSGTANTAQISGRGNGLYWYRVRACNVTCSGMRNGANFVRVTLPPSAPSSITVPATSSSGGYLVSWTAPSSGAFTRYELWEATNSSFSGATRIVNENITERFMFRTSTSGTYYYRVRACNRDYCGSFRTGNNPVVITLVQIPPAVAKSTLVGWLTSMCSWRATWGASTGATYYTFLDRSGQVSLSTETRQVDYSFCGLPGYTGNSEDYRPKWVKACNSGGCSPGTNF